MSDNEKQELERRIEWLKKGADINQAYIPLLKFIMQDYAESVHKLRKENEKN